MDTRQSGHRVLMFPFLAHGHISPFLELARNLKDRNFKVYFCSTPVNLKSIDKKLADYSIQPVEIQLPTPPDLPPRHHTTNGLPPHLIFLLIDALQKSGPVFSQILESVQPDLIIYDTRQAWLPPIAASQGIPSVFFQTTGAAVISFFLRSTRHPDVEFPSPAIFLMDYERGSYRRVKSPSNDADKSVDQFMSCIEQSTDMILIKSSREFEGKYIDFYSKLLANQKMMLPVGALIRAPEEDHEDNSEIIQWLNEKQEASTVYIAFGSECFLTKDELQEVASGLELCSVNFIWVARIPDGQETGLEEVFPEGFLDRVKGRGLVVEEWAPQAKVLAHPSIGGFVSHCGWGSLMESISFGVPIIAMPMQYDQPLNARLVVETGVGLEVLKGDNGQLKGEEIARVIRQVMVDESSEGIRRKVRDLAEKVKLKSGEEIDVAVNELKKICEKYKNHEKSKYTESFSGDY